MARPKRSCLDMLVIITCIVTELFLSGVESVDRGNFKTCNAASFCRRLRGAGGGSKSPYIVSPETIQIDETAGTVQALIANTESEDPNNPIKLRLEIFTNCFKI